jgi:hypothetical protein
MDAGTTVDLVHLAILKDAEEIANRRFAEEFNIDVDSPWKPGRFSAENRGDVRFAAGRIFRADPIRSDMGGLCLSVDEATIIAASDEQVDRIHQIGTEAIRDAIIINSNSFIGLILGDARQGNNYFDRYPQEAQTRLF